MDSKWEENVFIPSSWLNSTQSHGGSCNDMVIDDVEQETEEDTSHVPQGISRTASNDQSNLGSQYTNDWDVDDISMAPSMGPSYSQGHRSGGYDYISRWTTQWDQTGISPSSLQMTSGDITAFSGTGQQSAGVNDVLDSLLPHSTPNPDYKGFELDESVGPHAPVSLPSSGSRDGITFETEKGLTDPRRPGSNCHSHQQPYSQSASSVSQHRYRERHEPAVYESSNRPTTSTDASSMLISEDCRQSVYMPGLVPLNSVSDYDYDSSTQQTIQPTPQLYNDESATLHSINSNPTDCFSAPATMKQQKAKKEHRCDEDGCSWNRSFSTENDLSRHKRAVHHLLDSKPYYVCQGAACLAAGKTKIWPRKDNFRSHCKTTHPEECSSEAGLDGLVSRSEKRISGTASQSRDLASVAVGEEELQISPEQEARQFSRIQHAPSTQTTRPMFMFSNENAGLDENPALLSPRHAARQGSAQMTRASSQRPSTANRALSHRRTHSLNADTPLQRQRSQPTPNTDHSSIMVNLQNIPSELDKLTRHDLILELLKSRGQRQGAFRCEWQSAETEICGKSFKRECDLRKHETRHIKRWVCTSPVCFKRFGSKNDWKRHESTKHYQKETWICGREAENNIRRCLENFAKRDDFKKHLATAHGLCDDKMLQEEARRRRIGNNWSGAFWCGFCRDVIKLEKKNGLAWDERFDHFDEVHFKTGQGWKSWYPSNTEFSKEELAKNKEELERVKHEAFAGGEDDSVGFEDDQESPCSKEELGFHDGGVSALGHHVRVQQDQVAEKKRKREESLPLPSGQWHRYCCNCRHGPITLDLSDSCLNCDHMVCANCS